MTVSIFVLNKIVFIRLGKVNLKFVERSDLQTSADKVSDRNHSKIGNIFWGKKEEKTQITSFQNRQSGKNRGLILTNKGHVLRGETWTPGRKRGAGGRANSTRRGVA